MWLPVAEADAQLIDAVSDNDVARIAEGCTPGSSPTSNRVTIWTEAIGVDASATDSTLYWYWNSSRCTLRPDRSSIELPCGNRIVVLRQSEFEFFVRSVIATDAFNQLEPEYPTRSMVTRIRAQTSPNDGTLPGLDRAD